MAGENQRIFCLKRSVVGSAGLPCVTGTRSVFYGFAAMFTARAGRIA
ncbi:hypothetical protein PhaeoP75_01229 [Phaeobacter gallaeciensis]|uniref:Uncharacterized protein n=1 Tax=Phaeobacter gallaeciensis TaxID=60890 RepID=A0AAC9Z786_9RHOB|nr:hypothetical protein Gal_01187 [Phaeobacter gallaeciensis DSM 26640]ATE92224.1 hypothetical protein PhaeoP11_01182 [Phaeobacter gallaeciensis]ATE97957.1 hypothetical protein PhaeoP73_02667 [Phaeobacter gallaeciensis]ATF00886.1 hypothetical protein PhaeoP75_01229 [Phaeobacter gallaeciensis]ATF05266.1 hypothetical protein PhaeoP63_01177 [Phaeobacter gallaeciensis]